MYGSEGNVRDVLLLSIKFKHIYINVDATMIPYSPEWIVNNDEFTITGEVSILGAGITFVRLTFSLIINRQTFGPP